MNLYDISSNQMDDLASDYLNGQFESQYDDEGFYPIDRKISQTNEQLPDNNEIPF